MHRKLQTADLAKFSPGLSQQPTRGEQLKPGQLS
ncbi:hypothetical protein EV646_101425 [Kribbella antiqua]|uniref:Uncharacterized protein n=1 Tax=Kribbella antiqua TaxID=2512217 RepID=A0A4R2J8Z3_9ACTN|nr:hypothetical protein EV646_101425 [Kribbella antiqua]